MSEAKCYSREEIEAVIYSADDFISKRARDMLRQLLLVQDGMSEDLSTLNARNHALLADLDSLRAGAGWRSMDSAPKDGTKVDLWFPETGRATDWHFERGGIAGPEGMWVKRHRVRDPDDIALETYPNQQPTHWYLPAPPEGT